MSDCPEGCGWEFDKYSHPAAVYVPGTPFPLVWRAGEFRIPAPADAINYAEVRGVAIATHLIREHPTRVDVLALGSLSGVPS